MTSIRRPLAVATLAWSLASISHAFAATGMGADDARHLLTRTGFGASPTEIARFSAMSRSDGVETLLREVRKAPLTRPPAWAMDMGPLRPPDLGQASEAEKMAYRQQAQRQGLELRGWWVQEMIATPSPLTERMTLFWHNHFVSSQQKVRFPRMLYEQNATFRANALGNFGTLLHAAAREPAMVIYLDSAQNRKGTPNENFAREVMELFTLGEGNYTERDVKEAARAFTGYSIDRESGRFMLRPRLHDDDVKTVFGKTGNFDGDQVLDLLLARPETSRFIVSKLWREFVSPEPNAPAVDKIARDFRSTNYDLKIALRELLMSDDFWSQENRGTLVKSPVELVVGTLRTLEIAPDDALPFALAAAGMSQNLFAPPNVKGWPGGETWINSTTLLARKQFLSRVARIDEPRTPAMMPAPQTAPVDDEKARQQRLAMRAERGMREMRVDAGAWVSKMPGATPPDKFAAAQQVLLPLPPVTSNVGEAIAEREPMGLVRAALLDPTYQLK
jgi:uncharacterized protein (DUF1800 family)